MQQILIFVLLGMVLQSTEGSTLRVSYCPPNEPTNLENLLKSFGDILKEKVWSFEQRMKQLEKQQNTFLETLSARLENQLTWKSNVQTQGSQTSDNRTKEENMSNTDTQAVVTEQTVRSNNGAILNTPNVNLTTQFLSGIADPVNFDWKTFVLRLLSEHEVFIQNEKETEPDIKDTKLSTDFEKSFFEIINTYANIMEQVDKENTTESTSTETFLLDNISSTIDTQFIDAIAESPEYKFIVNYLLKKFKDMEGRGLPNSESAVMDFLHELMVESVKWAESVNN